MKQYGDITKLSGYELDPVDLIVGGSPCQDLSVAGKRAGLDGERSGLFMEMIRIIKEMRKKTNGIYPRYALWENVPGAFSSNDGRDFQAVLTEFTRVIQPDSPDVPLPEEGWPKSGILLGTDWSLAYRLFDAQFLGKTIRDSRTGDVLEMGTPQRRRRIALVADFRGRTAWDILFEKVLSESESLSGDPQPGEEEGERAAGDPQKSTGNAGKTYGVTTKGNGDVFLSEERHTSLSCGGGMPGQSYPCVLETEPSVISFQERSGKLGGGKGILIQKEHTGALSTVNNQAVIFGISSFNSNAMKSNNPKSGIYEADTTRTLDLNGGLPACNQGGMVIVHNTKAKTYQNVCGTLDCGISKGTGNQLANQDMFISNGLTVRRLTPKECERLQGFPDDWTNIPGASDSSRYKALGNSICLPAWSYWAGRFVRIGEVRTIGSLFDGIGGFPLVFKRAGAETLWTSEIEPFCQRVVEYHHERGEL